MRVQLELPLVRLGEDGYDLRVQRDEAARLVDDPHGIAEHVGKSEIDEGKQCGRRVRLSVDSLLTRRAVLVTDRSHSGDKHLVEAGEVVQDRAGAQPCLLRHLAQAGGLQPVARHDCARSRNDPVALPFDAGGLALSCHVYQRACSAVGARNSQPLKAIGP